MKSKRSQINFNEISSAKTQYPNALKSYNGAGGTKFNFVGLFIFRFPFRLCAFGGQKHLDDVRNSLGKSSKFERRYIKF